jgi:DNA-binding MarR family transcriptional regulator
MDDLILGDAELLVIGSVAITARALTAVGVDLTFLQWRAVLIVGDRTDGSTVSEVADRIGSHLSPASRLVSRLAARGLMQTAKDERDRRATRVTLSDSGHALRSQVLARRREDLRAVLGHAELTPAEQEGVHRLARSFGRIA